MTEKQIYEYALKGITADIEQLDKDIRQGYKYIEQIDKGEKVKTPKTKQEILDIIKAKKQEMENLEKEKFNIKWHLADL